MSNQQEISSIDKPVSLYVDKENPRSHAIDANDDLQGSDDDFEDIGADLTDNDPFSFEACDTDAKAGLLEHNAESPDDFWMNIVSEDQTQTGLEDFAEKSLVGGHQELLAAQHKEQHQEQQEKMNIDRIDIRKNDADMLDDSGQEQTEITIEKKYSDTSKKNDDCPVEHSVEPGQQSDQAHSPLVLHNVDKDGNCWYRCISQCIKSQEDIAEKLSNRCNDHTSARQYISGLTESQVWSNLIIEACSISLSYLDIIFEYPFLMSAIVDCRTLPKDLFDVKNLIKSACGKDGIYACQFEIEILREVLNPMDIGIITLNLHTDDEFIKTDIIEFKLSKLFAASDSSLKQSSIVLVKEDAIDHYQYLSYNSQRIIRTETLKDYIHDYLEDSELDAILDAGMEPSAVEQIDAISEKKENRLPEKIPDDVVSPHLINRKRIINVLNAIVNILQKPAEA